MGGRRTGRRRRRTGGYIWGNGNAGSFPILFFFKKINVYLDLFVEIAALTWAIFWLPWKNKFFLEHSFFVL